MRDPQRAVNNQCLNYYNKIAYSIAYSHSPDQRACMYVCIWLFVYVCNLYLAGV